MTCISCQREINSDRSGFIVCPYCGTVNTAEAFKPPGDSLPVADLERFDTPNEPTFKKSLPKLPKSSILFAAIAVCLLGGIVAAITVISKPSHKSPATPVTTNDQPTESTPQPDTTTSTGPVVSSSPVPSSSPSPSSSSSTSPPIAKPTVTPSVVIPSPPACAKGTYVPASASNTPTPAVGYRQIVDSPQSYTVYGYTADQILGQLQRCTPLNNNGAEFGGTTAWVKFGYSYHPVKAASKTCSIYNVAVDVHVTSIYPHWSNNADAGAVLNTEWQNYINHLNTHEQGHLSIALSDSSSFYNGLKGYPATACSSFKSAVNNYGNNQIAALNQAEVNYDAQTKYGATQGATFP